MLRCSRVRGVDDENMGSLGRCACIVFRRRGGGHAREGGEWLCGSADLWILVEGKQFGVLDNGQLCRVQLAQLFKLHVSHPLSAKRRKRFAYIRPSVKDK